jgi:hypothetical protein
MGIYVQRLEHLFMRVSQHSAHDPLLKRISVLVTAANRILDTARTSQPHRSMGSVGSIGSLPMPGSGRHGL